MALLDDIDLVLTSTLEQLECWEKRQLTPIEQMHLHYVLALIKQGIGKERNETVQVLAQAASDEDLQSKIKFLMGKPIGGEH